MGCLRSLFWTVVGLALLLEGLSLAAGSPVVVVSCPGDLPWLRTLQNVGFCATAGRGPTASPAGDLLAKVGPASPFVKKIAAEVYTFVDRYVIKGIDAVDRAMKSVLSK